MFCYNLCIAMVIVTGTSAVQPGFEARITPKGLSFLTEVGVRELEEEISKLHIPDISGTTDIFIGTIFYSVTNIRVNRFSFPSASIGTYSNVGVRVSARDISVSLRGDWHFSLRGLIPVSDSGYFDASISSVSLSLVIHIGVDKTGRPTVHSYQPDCVFYAGDASIDLHGGASWFYNLFDGEIENTMKHSLNSQVCQQVLHEVNFDLAKVVANMQIDAHITSRAEIDYSLVAAPTFQRSISTQHKGEVYEIGNHTEAPYKIPTIPSDQDETRMVFMWVTDFLANSAGYVLQNTNFFQYNITQDEIPAGSKFNLNTSNFATQFLIPQIVKLYPNMMMQINVNTTSAPKFNAAPDNVSSELIGDISAYVIQPNKSLTYLFTLSANMKLSATFGFRRSSLTWNSTFISADLKLLYSAIDNFKIDALRDGLLMACKVYVIPSLNELGAKGIPIPSFDDYAFVNPKVSQEKGVLKIGTDLAYQPGWLQL